MVEFHCLLSNIKMIPLYAVITTFPAPKKKNYLHQNLIHPKKPQVNPIIYTKTVRIAYSKVKLND